MVLPSNTRAGSARIFRASRNTSPRTALISLPLFSFRALFARAFLPVRNALVLYAADERRVRTFITRWNSRAITSL